MDAWRADGDAACAQERQRNYAQFAALVGCRCCRCLLLCWRRWRRWLTPTARVFVCVCTRARGPQLAYFLQCADGLHHAVLQHDDYVKSLEATLDKMRTDVLTVSVWRASARAV